jgi:hypothetical protein
MNNKWLAFALGILFVVCTRGNEPVLPRIELKSGGLDVDNFLVIGAFNLGGDGDYNGVDFLKTIGSRESAATEAEFMEGLRRLPEGKAKDHVREWRSAFLDFDYLYGYIFEKGNERRVGRVAYAAFVVHCEKPEKIWMLLGSCGALRVIVNGEDELHIDSNRGFSVYGESLEVSLKAGDNLVVIKAPKRDAIWGLRVHMSLDERDALKASLDGQIYVEKHLLGKSMFFSDKEKVVGNQRGVPGVAYLKGKVETLHGVVAGDLANKEVVWREGNPSEGLYKLAVTFEGETHWERFLTGNPLALLNRALGRLENFKENPHAAIAKSRLEYIRADYIKRYGEKDLPKSVSRAWSRRLINDLWGAERMLVALEAGKAPFKHVKGLNLCGFFSGIDGNLQCYRVCVPSSYQDSGNLLPVVIMFPTATSAARPFVESPFIQDYELANRLSLLAEKYKTIILWPGYRNQPAGNLSESAHLGEVLEAFKRDYDYDESRMALIGACSGAAMAMDAAADWSGRFAGLGFLDPEFVLDQAIPERVSALFLRKKEYREWFMRKRGVSTFLQTKSPPVYIVNDGGDAGHGDLDASLAFERRAKQAGAPVTMNPRPRTAVQHLGAWDEIIRWIVSLPPVGVSKPFERVRSNNVQDAMTEPFIVVQGTIGNEKDTEMLEKVVEQIKKEWTKVYFAPCKVMLDRDVNDEDVARMNMVLVGAPSSNSVWKRLENFIGVKINDDGISYGNYSWRGNSLNIQLVVPNPRNRGHKIILVGGHKPVVAGFGTLNLSRDGWFKGAVWSFEQGTLDLIDVF